MSHDLFTFVCCVNYTSKWCCKVRLELTNNKGWINNSLYFICCSPFSWVVFTSLFKSRGKLGVSKPQRKDHKLLFYSFLVYFCSREESALFAFPFSCKISELSIHIQKVYVLFWEGIKELTSFLIQHGVFPPLLMTALRLGTFCNHIFFQNEN